MGSPNASLDRFVSCSVTGNRKSKASFCDCKGLTPSRHGKMHVSRGVLLDVDLNALGILLGARSRIDNLVTTLSHSQGLKPGSAAALLTSHHATS